MHTAVKKFIKEVRKELPHKFRLRDVLEVGSKNINGSPRKYFWFCDYVGIDISAGKGVDFIGKLSNYPKTERRFDVAISCKMLEHDEDWINSLKYMYHYLKAGGLMIVTCASEHRKERGTRRMNPECSPDTTDYYKNISVEEFMQVLPQDLFETYVVMNARGKNDLHFYGIKHYKQ